MIELKTDHIGGGQREVNYRLVYRFLEVYEKAGFYVGVGRGEVHLVFDRRGVMDG